jgi:hypothetical protein
MQKPSSVTEDKSASTGVVAEEGLEWLLIAGREYVGKVVTADRLEKLKIAKRYCDDRLEMENRSDRVTNGHDFTGYRKCWRLF